MRSCFVLLFLALGLSACATQPAERADATPSAAQTQPGAMSAHMNGSFSSQLAYTRSH
jgi:hypothetical protein